MASRRAKKYTETHRKYRNLKRKKIRCKVKPYKHKKLAKIKCTRKTKKLEKIIRVRFRILEFVCNFIYILNFFLSLDLVNLLFSFGTFPLFHRSIQLFLEVNQPGNSYQLHKKCSSDDLLWGKFQCILFTKRSLTPNKDSGNDICKFW